MQVKYASNIKDSQEFHNSNWNTLVQISYHKCYKWSALICDAIKQNESKLTNINSKI